jgi:hypothetical protein
MQLVNRGSLSASVTSLFGISTPTAGSPTTPTLSTTGLGGVVMHPGDYAAVVHALDTINNGRSVIKSTVVVSNNAKAEINGVVQEPLGGDQQHQHRGDDQHQRNGRCRHADHHHPADLSRRLRDLDLRHLLRAPSTAPRPRPTQGTPIPPQKTANTVSSVATIPDGFVIALGGLVTRTTGRSETRIPLLGSIPFLGALFRSTSDTDSDSRFYVFIHASVLRHAAFADLRHSSDVSADDAELHDKTWPQLTPRFHQVVFASYCQSASIPYTSLHGDAYEYANKFFGASGSRVGELTSQCPLSAFAHSSGRARRSSAEMSRWRPKALPGHLC